MFQNKILFAASILVSMVSINVNANEWDLNNLNDLLDKGVDIASIDWSSTPRDSNRTDTTTTTAPAGGGAAAVAPILPHQPPITMKSYLLTMLIAHEARRRANPNAVETFNSFTELNRCIREIARGAIRDLNRENMEAAADTWTRLGRRGNANQLRAEFEEALARQQNRAPVAVTRAGY